MIRSRFPHFIFRLVLCSGLAVGQAGALRAADFRVVPINVRLAAAAPRGILTLENHSDEPLRFQVSTFAWEQDVDGKMKLAESDEVRVFPTLASVEPGDERKFRVVALARAGSVERSYRVFFEELPPLETSGVRKGVRVLTRVGIPVFLDPVRIVNQVRLDEASLDAGRVSVSVVNPGTVHAMVRTVRVTAYGGADELLFTRQAEGWYVLAGGARRFDFAVPRKNCRVRRVTIEAMVDRQTLSESLDPSPGSCRF